MSIACAERASMHLCNLNGLRTGRKAKPHHMQCQRSLKSYCARHNNNNGYNNDYDDDEVSEANDNNQKQALICKI